MRIALRRPRAVAIAWVAAIAVLTVLGAGVEERLNRSDIMVPGTPAAEAEKVARKHFGENANIAILIEGPPSVVDRETDELRRKLQPRQDLSVVGPWLPGAERTLQPKPGQALVLVRAERPFQEVSDEVVPDLQRELDRSVGPPAKAYLTGYAAVAKGLHESTVNALKRAEMIAAPLLLIVLLLVFRSPVAAALPLLLGGATVAAGRGVVDLVNRVVELDIVALNLGSMMGLALGVDYSLLMVSRFREELAAGRSPTEAVGVAGRTAGRTVLFAGIALVAAMIAATAVAPGSIMASSGAGTIVAVAMGVLGALTGLPAILVLLGARVDKWRIGRTPEDGGRWSRLGMRAVRRPLLAAGLVLGLVLALAAPTLALESGPPDPGNLPEDSRERKDFEKVVNTLSGGWSAPYEIVVVARKGRITDPERLQVLRRWQERLSRDPKVLAVMGPGEIAERAQDMRKLRSGVDVMQRELGRSKEGQARLASGLDRVDSGVEKLRGGLAQAADGAGALEGGSGAAAEGAQRLRAGLARAEDGVAELTAGLEQARVGAAALADGGARAARGARRLRRGLTEARTRLEPSLPRMRELRDGLRRGASSLEDLREPAQTADRELAAAWRALNRMTVGKADPQYLEALRSVGTARAAVTGRDPLTGTKIRPGYDGLDPSLAEASRQAGRAADGVAELVRGSEQLVAGLGRLERGARRLATGLGTLQAGAERLRAGLAKLDAGGGELSGGISRLESGGAELAQGAERLRDGAGRLAGGLRDGSGRSGQLESGVERMESGVDGSRERTERLERRFAGGPSVPGELFESGYLPLAALDGSSPDLRAGSSFAVNLDRGGDAARIVVVERGNPSRAGNELRPRLVEAARQLGREADANTAVGGPAAVLQDFDSESSGRLPLLVLALSVVTYLVLIPILRSLLLPLLAVVLNLATVFAALGVLTLGFTGSAPLGGPGDLDAIMVLAIFGIVFGLSIDYEVFLLARMREGWDRTRSTDQAIAYGLRTTAGVITGAAMIMTGVFAAFALSDVISMRQLGIGLSIAVLLDTTLVRLVLLPAVIRLAGDASWWLPGPLERRFERFAHLEGEGVREEGPVERAPSAAPA